MICECGKPSWLSGTDAGGLQDSLVVVTARDDDKVFVVDDVDQSVGLINATGPESGKILTQQLRLSYPRKRCAQSFTDQQVYPF